MGIINPDYTFESFEANIYNQRAYIMAKEYAEKKQGELLGIFGLQGAGKTRLLHAVANLWMKGQSEECVTFYPKGTLTEKLADALKNDKFLFKMKKEFKNTDIVCIDEVNEVFHDDDIHRIYNRLFNWWRRHHIHIVFTNECTEETYDVYSQMANSFGEGKLVGIPKPGQRRGRTNLENVVSGKFLTESE